MYFVTRELEFCYGHRLLNYDGKCKYLHGHNARIAVRLGSQSLDDRGMVVDFNEIKRLLRAWIDEELDHQLLLHEADPLLPVLRAQGQMVFVMDCNPTAENIARLIYEQAIQMGLPVDQVRLWETPRSSTVYRPD